MLAIIAAVALLILIIVSMFVPINVGIMGIVFAFIVGHFFGGMPVREIIAGYPVTLFMILVGVTFMFSLAQTNGTLEKITKYSIKAVRGNRALIPIVWFFLAMFLAAIGPGNIAIIALLAPAAMAMAGKMGISAFLMTVMIVNGASAGAFSPLAPTGIISNALTNDMGFPDMRMAVFFNQIIASSFVGVIGYVFFGGLKLLKEQKNKGALADANDISVIHEVIEPFDSKQKLTLLAILALVISVVFFRMDVGQMAFLLGFLLVVLRAAKDELAFKIMPWSTIMLVTGVTVLIAIIEEVGGLDLFIALIAQLSTPFTVTGVAAFAAGVVSTYSSSSGVVMPAFLPMVPGLVEKMPLVNPVLLVSAINVGAHLVDASPLSTLGALCFANAAAHEDRNKLFRNLIAWGLSMAVVGALIVLLLFSVLRLTWGVAV